jgi:hypothetical protein
MKEPDPKICNPLIIAQTALVLVRLIPAFEMPNVIPCPQIRSLKRPVNRVIVVTNRDSLRD